MQTPEAAAIDETLPVESAARPPVIRNAMFLVIAQVIVTPISVIVNAVAARHLGPADFGRMYLATTLATFALLFVEWGQTGALTGKVAIDRSRAGELLGSGLTWRLGAAAAVFIILPLGCLLAGYEWSFIQVLLLALCGTTLLTIANACQDVFRGFERTDFAAASYVGWQLLSALVSIPTLLLGGGIVALLTAQAACAAVSAIFVLKMLPRMNVPHLSMRAATVKELFLAGRGFLAFLVVIALQPVIDVAMLSKFGSADSMGWHAAARKLVGILIYPASALVAALYPTLCRLQMSDQPAFRKTAADAFHVTTIAVMPLALGCALFPDIGIMIFSEQSYGPAEDNLRLGHTVIADSVNPWPLTRDAWTEVARRAGTKSIDVEIVCSDERAHEHRLTSRAADPPGLKPLTFQEVLARDYRHWTRDHVIVDTARKSVQECVDEILAAIA